MSYEYVFYECFRTRVSIGNCRRPFAILVVRTVIPLSLTLLTLYGRSIALCLLAHGAVDIKTGGVPKCTVKRITDVVSRNPFLQIISPRTIFPTVTTLVYSPSFVFSFRCTNSSPKHDIDDNHLIETKIYFLQICFT